MQRFFQLICLIAVSWVVMTVTHESGHLIGGKLSGAQLTDFDLAPWRMPFSLHSPDPHPLITLWAGPVFGVAAPLIVAWILKHPWLWFIADFCLLANGCYLALSWLSGDRFLDSPRLLDAGSHPLSIAVFCLITIVLGYQRFRDDCVQILTPSEDRTH